ncbi:MAG TPA: hypothetical protein VFP65_24340, partial [Anaeromyxobacteraceae bacterium]|nr:hypothetical protein [Anaeromyxobacteraceae bacterium]
PSTVSNGQSTAIVLAPAVTLSAAASIRPLDEKHRYLVIVTSAVKDAQGQALRRSTLMDLVFTFQSDLCVPKAQAPQGTCKSQVPGVSDADAAGLQVQRDLLKPVLTGLNLADCSGTNTCAALVYTVKTQTVTDVSLQLAAAPYAIENGAGQPIFRLTGAPTPFTPPAGLPTTNVSGFFTIPFNSIDGIDKTTGAFRPTLATDLTTPATVPTLLAPLTAFVAVPNAANVPLCPSPPFPAGARCAKLVVFGHGLNGKKEDMLAVADSLAARGFIAAAIDFPLHGARNWCSASSDCVNTSTGADGTCTPFTGANQGDAIPPGVCSAGSVPKIAGSRYFITANFFRMRDALRQNALDQSALVLAMARPPTGVPPVPAGQDPLAAILPAGVIVDPSAVYYQGLSLGSIAGTQVVATNPRMSRAALSVGGGTFVDIGITSPTFQPQLAPVLGGLLGIPNFSFALVTPGNAAFNPTVFAAFNQLVAVAKWVLDPGDPVNYARNLRTAPLPNLLANPNGSVPQAAKQTWGQISLGDTVVPNPTNSLLYNLIGGPTTVYSSASAPNNAVSHALLAQQDASGAQVRSAAADFLVDGTTVPPATVTLP